MSITAIIKLFSMWRRYHAGLRDLSALDERMLRDIGLTRSQIRNAARGAAQR